MQTKTTKEKILSAALRLFARDGYEGVSVEQIAAAVGIKAPSLYKHYQGKRDIFDSILARMAQMDAMEAAAHDMPTEPVDTMTDAYRTTSLESIRSFTKAQFLHWTEEPFSSDFRKLLTLEQYRSPEMAALYRQYLAGGPLAYMRDIFAAITEPSLADALALEFYAPMFLLYSLYDETENKQLVLKMLDDHLDRFLLRLSDRHEKKENEL